MSRSVASGNGTGIAIIGMAGRFPKAASVEELWTALRDGVEALSTFSPAELLAAGVAQETLEDPDYVPVAGALDGADLFAASFFGYTAREALIMDPSQRILLEVAWQALESAGYGNAPPRTGVFAGASVSTYLLNRLVARPDLFDGFAGLETTLGTDKDFLATRIAYKLDLRGPAVSVQTACSSSLVAVHLACQSLAAGDCDMAVAGGASVDVPQRAGYLYQPQGIYSSDGHCRPFDARADGMVGGSGAGAVILKRLDRAQSDGDTIHAVILGSAINNDGANKVGYTAPSVEAQSEVIASAHVRAGIAPESLGLVETHGTGTALGDPIEFAALTEAFASDRRRFCALGGIKANIGHLNAAAGISGLIKATLAVREGEIPPAIHFDAPSPHIDLDNSPFFINTELQAWPQASSPRRAGISSFGMGGTNAHVVIEQAPLALDRPEVTGPQVLMLSARTDAALDAARRRLADALTDTSSPDLRDVAFTLQAGRRAFGKRRAVVCESLEEGARQLRQERATISGTAPDGGLATAFMLPGQGAQHPGMGRALYETREVFRCELERCCALFSQSLPFDLLPLILSADGDDGLNRTEVSQTSLFAVQYALAALWKHVGIEPAALLGHSVGEYTAACIAGIFSLEDAVKLVAARGLLLQALPGGAMLAVQQEASELRQRLSAEAVVAAVNEPGSVIVSGPTAVMDELHRELTRDGIATQSLHVSHAFHSPMMLPAVDALLETLRELTLAPPKIPLVSTVTGTWITAEEATDPSYWAEHLMRPVRFMDGLTTLLEHGVGALLEVGPGTTLTALARRHPRHGDERIIASLPHPKSAETAEHGFLKAAATLWTAGAGVTAPALAEHPGRRVPLPTYPFERQRFWIGATASPSEPAADPSLRLPMDRWCYTPSWQRCPLPPVNPTLDGSTVLVFDDGDVAAGLRESSGDGPRIISVRTAREFSVVEPDHYRIDPGDASHYERLIRALGETEALTIVHSWALAGRARRDSPNPALGFDSLLLAAKAIGRMVGRADWIVLTQSAHEVTGDEDVDPEQAMVLGPCRVITLEYAGHRCRNLDLAEHRSGDSRQIETLRRELSFPDDEAVVAYRGGHRWLPSFVPLPMPDGSPRPPWLENGVCLVTGGLSGIGAALAEAVARQSRAPRLALLARSPLPPRPQWEARLEAAGPTDRQARSLRTVLALEARGCQVLALAADVADRDSLAVALEMVRREFGGIDCVVHAAGIAGGGAMALKSLADADEGMAAKVRGTRNLWDLTRQDGVASFVLCSSLAAEMGGFGQVDYCAANAFQDAFATANRTGGVQTIDWDTWSETGMALDTEVPAELEAERAENLRMGLSTREGQEVFLRILASGESRVLVSTRQLSARLEAQRAGAVPTEVPDADPSSRMESGARPDLSTHFSAPDNALERQIAEIWQQLFGLETVGRDDDFFELGGHSLLGTQLLNRLRKTHPTAELSLALLFERPTIAQLAAALEAAGSTPSGRTLPSLEDLTSLPEVERRTFFERYLSERLGTILDGRTIAIEQLSPQLVWDLRRDLGLSVYPHELRGADSVVAVASLLTAIAGGELVAHAPTPANKPSAGHRGRTRVEGKNPTMVFLLSAPRSGSTLLRLMLAGHPQLFCPPELALLTVPGMKEWIDLQKGLFARDGLTRCLMELEGLSEAQARSLIAEMAVSDIPVQDVYRRLQRHLGSRLLVDKSPAYALDIETLERAEALFDEPRYILLTRHPLSVIDSFVRHRMEALLATGPIDSPAAFAAEVWTTCNRNLLELEEALGARAQRLSYEELVTHPETTLRRLTEGLDLTFRPELLDPYGPNRMIDGPGDPDILQHDGIDARLAESWRSANLSVSLSDEARRIAVRLGYEIPMPADRKLEKSTDTLRHEELLERIDELSDEEVTAALEELNRREGSDT